MNRLIFGCGFLGLPTAKGWSSSGSNTYGITRKQYRFSELRSNGIQPLLGDIVDPDSLGNLPSADTVLVAVGMDRSTYSDIRQVYVQGLQHILDALPSDTGHIIYISSTGVFGDMGGDWVDEESDTKPTREGGRACLEAEELIRTGRFANRFTILRFAGLYGHSRVPMQTAIENRDWEKLTPHGSLNLIHVDDGASIIHSIADLRPFGETYLVSDGHPVARQAYYDEVARIVKTGPIPWPKSANTTPARSDKKISNRKLMGAIELELKYPDYLSGLKEALG